MGWVEGGRFSRPTSQQASHLASHLASHHYFVHASLPHRPSSQDVKMMSPIHGVCDKIVLMEYISDRGQLCTLRFPSVTTTFAAEHTSNAVILCFVFLVFMGGSKGKATCSTR